MHGCEKGWGHTASIKRSTLGLELHHQATLIENEVPAAGGFGNKGRLLARRKIGAGDGHAAKDLISRVIAGRSRRRDGCSSWSSDERARHVFFVKATKKIAALMRRRNFTPGKTVGQIQS